LQRRLAILAMLTAVGIYGANFGLTRHATLNGLTPADIAALRFGTAGLLLLPLFLRHGASTCAGIGWGRGLLLALMSGVPMVLIMNTGLSLAPAAHGASIQPGTVTLLGAVGSIVLFGAVPTRFTVIGIAIVLAGLACIGLAGSTSGSSKVILGDLCFLAAGTLWGLYPLMLQRWNVGAIPSTAVIAVLSLAYLPFYALLAKSNLGAVDPLFVLFHAFNQGVLNVIVGLWLWGTAVRVLGAEVAQRFPPLIPVVGTLSAVPILGEWPGLLQSLGVAFIVSGLLLTAFGARLFRRAAPVVSTAP
jgi:drug/metabolite transporter (DMT)-like permease